MSRISHLSLQPMNIHWWDYYILCHLNTEAAIALQRMEYWDGTKDDGNVHAEDINDALEQKGKDPTQDTSQWIYKSQEELQWELMGLVSVRSLPKVLNLLIDELKYLERRNNPIVGFDRKKQYLLKAKEVQAHINYLNYIISYFHLPLRRLKPVFYAIELLTSEGVHIDTLNVKQIILKIDALESDESTPHFIQTEIAKFRQAAVYPGFSPFCNFAEWKVQNCRMDAATLQNALRTVADWNLQNCRSNSIEDITENTSIEDITEERESTAPESHTPTVSPPVVGDAHGSLTEFDEKMMIKEAEIRQMLEGQATEEIIQQTIETFRQAVLVHREARYLDLPIPTTYNQAVIFLAPHGGIPPGYDAVEVMKLAQKLWVEAHESEMQSQQGDAHATLPPGSADRAGTLPSADMGDLPASGQDRPVASPATRPVLEAGEEIAVSKKGQADGQLEQNTPTPLPAQATPPQSEQAALGQAPKWNVAAMVAEAERLREKPFSAIARPKETKKAQALFKRKPDLTQEEFEAAWRHWATPWWHENNGLFTLTDLAATPKNKSEMRLIIALEKLERGKPPLFTVPKQSTFVPRPSKIEVPDDFILSAYRYR